MYAEYIVNHYKKNTFKMKQLQWALKSLNKVFSCVFLILIRFYQMAISPHLPKACRFTPTCSQYAIEAILKYGALKGGWLTFRRILRCNPWGKSGYDPVP